MSDAPERWIPLAGEPTYLISTHGQLWNIRSQRIIKGSRTREGYTTHDFGGRLNRHTRRLHCMVLESFAGPRPDGQYGCHDDGDPTNNRLSNLRWDTPVGNTADKVKHGTDYQRNKVRCPRRHLLEGKNLVLSDLKAGKRSCRACNNAQSLALLREKRGHPALDAAEYADHKYAEYMNPRLPGPRKCDRGHLVTAGNAQRVTKPDGRVSQKCRACATGNQAVLRAASRGVELDLITEANRLYLKYMADDPATDDLPLDGAA